MLVWEYLGYSSLSCWATPQHDELSQHKAIGRLLQQPLQIFWSHIPNGAIISHTPNIPQNDTPIHHHHSTRHVIFPEGGRIFRDVPSAPHVPWDHTAEKPSSLKYQATLHQVGPKSEEISPKL